MIAPPGTACGWATARGRGARPRAAAWRCPIVAGGARVPAFAQHYAPATALGDVVLTTALEVVPASSSSAASCCSPCCGRRADRGPDRDAPVRVRAPRQARDRDAEHPRRRAALRVARLAHGIGPVERPRTHVDPRARGAGSRRGRLIVCSGHAARRRPATDHRPGGGPRGRPPGRELGPPPTASRAEIERRWEGVETAGRCNSPSAPAPPPWSPRGRTFVLYGARFETVRRRLRIRTGRAGTVVLTCVAPGPTTSTRHCADVWIFRPTAPEGRVVATRPRVARRGADALDAEWTPGPFSAPCGRRDHRNWAHAAALKCGIRPRAAPVAVLLDTTSQPRATSSPLPGGGASDPAFAGRRPLRIGSTDLRRFSEGRIGPSVDVDSDRDRTTSLPAGRLRGPGPPGRAYRVYGTTTRGEPRACMNHGEGGARRDAPSATRRALPCLTLLATSTACSDKPTRARAGPALAAELHRVLSGFSPRPGPSTGRRPRSQALCPGPASRHSSCRQVVPAARRHSIPARRYSFPRASACAQSRPAAGPRPSARRRPLRLEGAGWRRLQRLAASQPAARPEAPTRSASRARHRCSSARASQEAAHRAPRLAPTGMSSVVRAFAATNRACNARPRGQGRRPADPVGAPGTAPLPRDDDVAYGPDPASASRRSGPEKAAREHTPGRPTVLGRRRSQGREDGNAATERGAPRVDEAPSS